MVALKKAYADIILNTAKEAAARIMVSERKALQFQQDLFAAKEEALNMLLRLKQLMDSKIAEAETTSLSQRRRIEEFELQLCQADDTIRHLRSELKIVQDEFQKLKNSPLQPLSEVEGNAVSYDDSSKDKKPDASESIICPPLVSGPRPTSTNDMKNMPVDQRNAGEKCCPALENATTQIEPLIDSSVEKYYSGREPELYRNGCTQRIRAFERNALDGELPLPGQRDDQCLSLKNDLIVREGKKVEETSTVASPKDENIMERNQTELGLMQHDSNCNKGDVKFFHRFKRRRKARCRKATSCRFIPDQAMKPHEPSFLSRSKPSAYLVNGDVESGEDPSNAIEGENQNCSDSHLASLSQSNATGMDTQLGCVDGVGSELTLSEAGNCQNATSKDSALIDESALTSQDSKAAVASGDTECNTNLETAGVQLMNSDPKDGKTFETTGGVPTQAVNDRLLKYTFRRKRKKESLSSPDENASLEKKSMPNRRTRDNQSSAQEPQKSSLIIESSRDSRRLVQVARQLISLSEKRWW
ncbi:PREDICTED: uncharacterized protein LOC104596210 isoform X2 [Nelumbo nucifera]|nr:PREDICTED: uncharacterized protein LOC104596210 isoform X2 [Nelumbo nucifera]